MHPLINLSRECEDRAAITGTRTADWKSGATLPSLGGANAALQVRSNLFPGLQRIAAQLSLAVSITVSIAVALAVIHVNELRNSATPAFAELPSAACPGERTSLAVRSRACGAYCF